MLYTRVVPLMQTKQMGVMGPQGQVQMIIGPRPGDDVNKEIDQWEKEGFQVLANTPAQQVQFNQAVILMYKAPEEPKGDAPTWGTPLSVLPGGRTS